MLTTEQCNALASAINDAHERTSPRVRDADAVLSQIATRLNQRSGPHGADLALISILDLVESALGAEVQFLRYHNSRDELERLLVDRYSDQLRTHADKT